ncbi:hypothetical protein K4580_001787 [Salmonella enterica]|nr:hypothetical protein [Salmonella enterica]EBE6451243.1 hypothetical protein [Salmonella enterica]EFS3459172.1 hypothetical protein [Salmonella enterica]EGN7050684.1 hypothetical protein [Salmonella enterica]EGW6574017.1 hypothetical protein [Salmonella enterica]
MELLLMRNITTLTGLMIALSVGLISRATLANTLDFDVLANVQTTSCSLNVPATHNLGRMSAGTKQYYRELNVNVDCHGQQSVMTRVAVQAVNGTIVDSDTVQMNGLGSTTSVNPPLLQMATNKGGKYYPVTLDGALGDRFCFDNETPRNCSLTPIVNVPVNAQSGSVKVNLRFTIMHE